MSVPLERVISGGQTGVDQAALRAAQAGGLRTGGWCPPDRRCEAGVIPARFPMRATPRERSDGAPDVPRSLRTEWNVRDADMTLVLQPARPIRDDVGSAWTIRCAERFDRPLLLCDPADSDARRIAEWLARVQPRVLNVAGPSEATSPGIGAQTFALLAAVFDAADAALLRVRPAEPDESDRLTRIAVASKASWGYSVDVLDPWREELRITPESIRTHPTFVLDEAGRIAGVQQLSEDADGWTLEHFWVDPDCMGRGVRRLLLERARDHVAASGGDVLHVDADPHAEAFYLRCGAERSGVVPAPIPGEPGRVRPQLQLPVGVR